MVLNRIGQSAPKTARLILVSGPLPMSTISSGIRATGGTGRMNSTSTLVARRTAG